MRLDWSLITLAARDLRSPVLVVCLIGLAGVACWVAQALLIVNALALVFQGSDLVALGPWLVAILVVVVVRARLHRRCPDRPSSIQPGRRC